MTARDGAEKYANPLTGFVGRFLPSSAAASDAAAAVASPDGGALSESDAAFLAIDWAAPKARGGLLDGGPGALLRNDGRLPVARLAERIEAGLRAREWFVTGMVRAVSPRRGPPPRRRRSLVRVVHRRSALKSCSKSTKLARRSLRVIRRASLPARRSPRVAPRRSRSDVVGPWCFSSLSSSQVLPELFEDDFFFQDPDVQLRGIRAYAEVRGMPRDDAARKDWGSSPLRCHCRAWHGDGTPRACGGCSTRRRRARSSRPSS